MNRFKRSKQTLKTGLLLITGLLLCSCSKPQAPHLQMYAGAGLRTALETLCSEFEAATGTAVDVDYAGSGLILARVQNDPQADLFLPADIWYVNRLNELAGSVEKTVPAARLIPVLIVAKGNPKRIAGLQDLLRPDLRTALGNPKACQVGRITALILERTGLDWDQVADKESLTVNELAVWVKMNAVDAAVVWNATAAAVADSVDCVQIKTDPTDLSSVAGVRLSTSQNPEMADAFLQFMAGPEGQAIWKQYGYLGAAEIQ